MPASFLSIPPELRELIYSHLWADEVVLFKTAKPVRSRSEHDVDHPIIETNSPEKEFDSFYKSLQKTQEEVNQKNATKSSSNQQPLPPTRPHSWEEPDTNGKAPLIQNLKPGKGHKSTRSLRSNAGSHMNFTHPLLQTSRQIRLEASPVLWRSLHLVFERPRLDTFIPMILHLSPLARNSLSSLALPEILFTYSTSWSQPGKMFTRMNEECDRKGWYINDRTYPEYRDAEGMTFNTPFVAFLYHHLPNLKFLWFYADPEPVIGEMYRYPVLAAAELFLLLEYGRLEKLHFVYADEEVVERMLELSKTPSSPDASQQIRDTLLGPMGGDSHLSYFPDGIKVDPPVDAITFLLQYSFETRWPCPQEGWAWLPDRETREEDEEEDDDDSEAEGAARANDDIEESLLKRNVAQGEGMDVELGSDGSEDEDEDEAEDEAWGGISGAEDDEPEEVERPKKVKARDHPPGRPRPLGMGPPPGALVETYGNEVDTPEVAEWRERREAYVRRRKEDLVWEWGGSGVEMGPRTKDVFAVISMSFRGGAAREVR